MLTTRILLGTVAATLLASIPAVADHPIRSYFGVAPSAPKPPKPYPILENRFIKQYSGPSVSCSACYGYHHTTWRPWAEACGEPIVVESGPQMAPPTPPQGAQPKDAAPKPMEKAPVPMEPKPDPKPLEKKKVEAAPSFSIPVTPDRAQVSIPAIPELKPIATIKDEPKAIVPTIIVPLNSK